MVERSESIDEILQDVTVVISRMRAEGTNQAAWLSLDLTMAQMKALMVVLNGHKDNERVTSRAIATVLHVGPSAVTPLVDKLVRQKLVKREPDANDRRVTFIVPTAKALALQDKLLAAGRAFWVAMLDELDAAELAAARRTFGALAASLRNRASASARARASRAKEAR